MGGQHTVFNAKYDTFYTASFTATTKVNWKNESLTPIFYLQAYFVKRQPA